MTGYAKLVLAEQSCHTIEIREKETGKEGVANSCADGGELFYGADDGNDDKTVDILRHSTASLRSQRCS